MFYIIVGVYFLFLGFAQQLSKRLDRVVTYIHTVSDANNLFAAYNFHKKMMAYNIAAIILVILLGGFILTMLEDWSFIEGVYFALETSTVS
jgi:cytochrome b subunit of formate dehydrogenase